MRYDHLPVFLKCEELLTLLYSSKQISSVTRDLKYTMVEQLKEETFQVLESIYDAQYSESAKEKTEHLHRGRLYVMRIKLRIRVLKSCGAINEKLYATLLEYAQDMAEQMKKWYDKTKRNADSQEEAKTQDNGAESKEPAQPSLF